MRPFWKQETYQYIYLVYGIDELNWYKTIQYKDGDWRLYARSQRETKSNRDAEPADWVPQSLIKAIFDFGTKL